MKRKRSRASMSGADKSSETTKLRKVHSGATEVRPNPFLSTDTAVETGRHETETIILSHVLKFDDLSKANGKGDLGGSSQAMETLDVLVRYVHSSVNEEKTGSSADRSSVSPLISSADVADLLFPWATRVLLQVPSVSSVDLDLVHAAWNAMATCLSFLLTGTDEDTIKGNSFVCSRVATLSQSTMNKLVPLATDVAFSESPSASLASQSFDLMTSSLYRPTLNVACESILLSVEEKARSKARDDEDGRPILAHDQGMTIVAATANFLRRLQIRGVASPKKEFQVLSDRRILGSLAYLYSLRSDTDFKIEGLQSVIRDLIWDGLFNPSKHMDGFRSMEISIPSIRTKERERKSEETDTVKTFQCYQSHLLTTLKDLVLGESAVKEHKLASIRFVPMIVKGFVVQSTEWEQGRGGLLTPRGRVNCNVAAAIQFRFWANLADWLLLPLLESNSQTITLKNTLSDESRELVNSLHETLKILLKHDTYLPSHDDKEERSLDYLRTLAGQFSSMAYGRPGIVPCIDLLVRLNHHTVHDNLARTVLICSFSSSSPHTTKKGSSSANGAVLLSTLVFTYQKLRQIDHLFKSMIKAAHILCGEATDNVAVGFLDERPRSNEGLMVALLHLLQDRRVSTAIFQAVHHCPPGQLAPMFSELSSCIRKHFDGLCDGAGKIHEGAMCFVSSLLELLVRNAYVESHTARDVARLCNVAVEQAIQPALNDASLTLRVRRQMLMLFGWLIDLRIKSLFWLDDDNEANDIAEHSFSDLAGDTLAVVLSEDSLLEETTKGSGEWTNSSVVELQFLALFRVQQLHSQIFERERKASSPDWTGENDATSLVREAKRLVDFAINLGGYGDTDNCVGSDAHWLVASRMIPYWVPYAKINHISAFLSWVVSTIATADDSFNDGSRFPNSTGVALSLVQDTSFFELPSIMVTIRSVGIAYVAERVKVALDSFGGDCIIAGINLVNPIGNPTWKAATPKQLATILGEMDSFVVTSTNQPATETEQSLATALRAILLINGIPRQTRSSNDNLIDSCIRLVVLTRSMVRYKDGPYESVSCDLLLGMLSFASAALVDMAAEPTESVLLADEHVLRGLVGVPFSICAVSDVLPEAKAVGPCIRLLESLVVYCFSKDTERTMCISALTEGIELCCKKYASSHNSVVHLSRSAVRRMALIPDVQDFLRSDRPREAVTHLLSTLQSRFFVAGRRSLDPLSGSLLLASDLAHLSSKINDKELYQRFDTLVTQEIASQAENHGEALSYCLTALVASGRKTPKVFELVLNQCLVTTVHEDRLLESVLCDIAPSMKPEQIQHFIRKLLVSCDTARDAARALRLFELLIAHIDSSEQKDQVVPVAREFFMVAINLLSPSTGAEDDSSSVVAGCSATVALLQDRDIFHVRERDLALILSQTSALLGFGTVPTQIYSVAFDLLSLLMQRFPKQLYTCVASVISVIHSLLRHVIASSSSIDTADRAKKFARICELLVPHRDVYRKHVLGILLEFVGSDDMDPTCKKNLLPGVYSLLDMMTHYETQQLNALMDTTGKASFRTVYQSFQKLHKYKGQY